MMKIICKHWRYLEKKTLFSHQCNLVQNKNTISFIGRLYSTFIDRLYMLWKIINVVWYLILESVYRCCLEKKTLSSHQCNLVQNKNTISSIGCPCSMFIDRLYMFLKIISVVWYLNLDSYMIIQNVFLEFI